MENSETEMQDQKSGGEPLFCCPLSQSFIDCFVFVHLIKLFCFLDCLPVLESNTNDLLVISDSI